MFIRMFIRRKLKNEQKISSPDKPLQQRTAEKVNIFLVDFQPLCFHRENLNQPWSPSKRSQLNALIMRPVPSFGPILTFRAQMVQKKVIHASYLPMEAKGGKTLNTEFILTFTEITKTESFKSSKEDCLKR